MNIKEDIWKRIMFSSEFMYNAVEKYRFRKAIFLLPFSLKSFFETNRKKDILRKNNYIYNINVSNNIKLYLPLIDNGDMIQNKIFFSEDFYEGNILRHIMYKYISHGKQENKYTIVDVGGNIGNHSIFFASQIKNVRIFVFEPMKETYRILEKNIEINKFKNKIYAYNLACGDIEGNASAIAYNPYDTGGTSIKNDVSGKLKVVRLDDMIKEKVDFIKIDVEGFEYNVLLGAKNILNRYSPVIFIEVFEQNKYKVFELLKQFSYKKIEDLGENNYIFMK